MIFNNNICNTALCDCCKTKCKDINHFKSVFTLTYVKTDTVPTSEYSLEHGTRLKSVDCFRASNSSPHPFILVEIKNSPLSNLTCSEILEQISGTITYLKIKYVDTLKNGIRFFLSVSCQKNATKLDKIKAKILQSKLDMFYDTTFKIVINYISYKIPSKIITCPETETYCK